MPTSAASRARRFDSTFWWSAVGCLALSVFGAVLLKAALTENPDDTGIARSYAVAMCCSLIFALPAFIVTIKWHGTGAILMWLLTTLIAVLAALAGAFGLATPLIVVLIFAASIATATWHKHRRIAPISEAEFSS
jgi:uncharacterized membrane protein YhaH (DUF805 family)